MVRSDEIDYSESGKVTLTSQVRWTSQSQVTGDLSAKVRLGETDKSESGIVNSGEIDYLRWTRQNQIS